MSGVKYQVLVVLGMMLFLWGCAGGETAVSEIASEDVGETAVIQATNSPESHPTPTTEPLPTEVNALALLQSAEAEMQTLESISWTRLSESFGDTTGSDEIIIFAKEREICSLQLPAQVYCEHKELEQFLGTPSDVSMETVQRGETVWRRQGGSWWIADDLDEFPVIPLGIISIENDIVVIKLSDYVLDAEIVGNEELNGLPVYEISLMLDAEKYNQLLTPMDMSFLSDTGNAEFEGLGTVWIGQEDLLIYRYEAEINVIINDSLTAILIETDFDSFNEPVEFPNPEDDLE